MRPYSSKSERILAAVAFLGFIAGGDIFGQGQGPLLRMGPFNFDAKTRLEAIYTTNVEGERKSEATADREDWYLVWGLDLQSTADLMPRTKISIETGIAIEEHFNRPDLNNSDNPFGRIGVTFDTDLEPLKLNGGVRYESTSESVNDKFIPKETGLPKKKRQVGTTFDYNAGATWQGEKLNLLADYSMTQERFDSEEFFEEEQNEQTITYEAGLKLATIKGIGVGATYSIDFTDTELINKEDGITEEETETISLDLDTIELWKRPLLEYSFGMQREYTDGETKGWEMTHTVTLSDDYDISPVLNLKGSISYKREEKPEEDDMELMFDLTLTHEISKRSKQTLSASRSPVDTLGSNLDTDETSYNYGLNVQDFVFPNIAFSFSAGLTIDKPVEGEEERTTDAAVGLSHSTPVNARLTRSINYDYTVEDSNLEDELLEEHRITLSFVFQL